MGSLGEHRFASGDQRARTASGPSTRPAARAHVRVEPSGRDVTAGGSRPRARCAREFLLLFINSIVRPGSAGAGHGNQTARESAHCYATACRDTREGRATVRDILHTIMTICQGPFLGTGQSNRNGANSALAPPISLNTSPLADWCRLAVWQVDFGKWPAPIESFRRRCAAK